MPQLPALFISHGAPDLPLRSNAATDFLKQLRHTIPTPQSILVISAHWNTQQPTVSMAVNPRTIHDFSGFPAALYQMHYPAPGAIDLAQRVVDLATTAGIECKVSLDRGLDHGAWTPLVLAYPQADIPVTQLSIQPHLNPAHHFLLGQALAPLRDEGVLILASGSATHNLWAMNPNYHAPPQPQTTEFIDWLTKEISSGSTEKLLEYRLLAPHAAYNHPTEEHLLPLFVAMGAAGKHAKGTQIHTSFTYGNLSMAAYKWTGNGQQLNNSNV
jgi:4,5-DOPA dioxygenase extradiol